MSNLPGDTHFNPILAAAMAAVEESAALTTSAQIQIDQSSNSSIAIEEDLQTSIANIAVDSQIVDLTENIAKLKTQTTRVDALESAGGSSFLIELMAELQESSGELIAAQDVVEDITTEESSGPINFIGQQFRLIRPTIALEAAEDRVNNLTSIIGSITSSQESIARAVATTQKTVTTATIDAGQRIISEQANIDLARSRLSSIASRAEELRSGMAANSATVAAKIQLLKLKNTEEAKAQRAEEHKFNVSQMESRLKQYESEASSRSVALATAQENLADIQDPRRRALVTAQREAGVSNLETARIAEDLFTTNVQIGQSVSGAPIEEPAAIITRGMPGGSGSAADRLKYTKLRDIGLREGNTYGASPAEALETISMVGASSESPPARLLLRLNTEFQEFKLSTAGGGKLPTNQAQYMQELDSYVQPSVDSWRAEIKEGDASNPFQAPPMTILAERTAIKESKLYKNVLAPASMSEFNAKRLYELAVSGIASKSVTIEEAALGLETIFDGAVDHNNETIMYDRVGIDEQTSYMAEVVDTAFFASRLGGATGGAAGGAVAVGAATLAFGPVGTLAAVGALAGGTILGSNVPGAVEARIIDNTDRVQITRALNKLIAREASTLGGLFK